MGCGKVMYVDRKTAEAQIPRSWLRWKKAQYPYYCKECRCWHLATINKDRKK